MSESGNGERQTNDGNCLREGEEQWRNDDEAAAATTARQAAVAGTSRSGARGKLTAAPNFARIPNGTAVNGKCFRRDFANWGKKTVLF